MPALQKTYGTQGKEEIALIDMKLVLIGIQGAGKSTQGNLLSKQLKIPYLSTGHIFREIAKEKTTLGRYVKETINAGILVPDKKTIEIVDGYLSRPEYQSGYILDGFPRTPVQAKEFSNNVDKVIYLHLEDKEAIWRLLHRDDVSRDDETLPALKKRMELFHKFTEPVVEYYQNQNKVVEIDATQTIKQVNQQILKGLGRQLIRNQVKIWQQKQKAIIAIVGMPGSGKTETAQYFRDQKKAIVSFSNILNSYIDEHKLKHDEPTHKRLREGWRKKYGMAAFAILGKDMLSEAIKKNTIVFIEGMRSWEEYLYVKKNFPEVRVYILALYADKELRYERSSKRKYRKGLYGETRDIEELIGTNMGPTIAYADFMIKNNYSLDDLHDKLDEVYRRVYFS